MPAGFLLDVFASMMRPVTSITLILPRTFTRQFRGDLLFNSGRLDDLILVSYDWNVYYFLVIRLLDFTRCTWPSEHDLHCYLRALLLQPARNLRLQRHQRRIRPIEGRNRPEV